MLATSMALLSSYALNAGRQRLLGALIAERRLLNIHARNVALQAQINFRE